VSAQCFDVVWVSDCGL